MQERVQDQETARYVSRQRSDFQIEACNTRNDNGENRDVGENKCCLTSGISKVAEQG